MSFNISDMVTGQSIHYNDKVVIFRLVSVPRAEDESQEATPIYPTHLYRLDSFPIKGKYDDAGEFVIDDTNQLGVQVAKTMGVDFENQNLYLWGMMHENTYEWLQLQSFEYADVPMGPDVDSKLSDIEAAKSIIEACKHLLMKPKDVNDSGHGIKITDAHCVLRLNARNGIHPEELVSKELAKHMGGSILTAFNISGSIGDAFTRQFRTCVQELINKQTDVTQVCTEVWECTQMVGMMYNLHRRIMPSMYAGGDDNVDIIAEAAINTLTQCTHRNLEDLAEKSYGTDGSGLSRLMEHGRALESLAKSIFEQVYFAESELAALKLPAKSALKL